MTQTPLFKHEEYSSLDEAYVSTLKRLIESGDELKAGDSKSTGSGKSSQEILNFNQSISNPRKRLLANPKKSINLPAAIARFIWMMSGSDRLFDIAMYEPKVGNFTDDDISVPGSSYGHRILQSRPGLNQLEAVVDRLRKDKTTRRAAISIYHPEDAVRDSHDIPCTFGLMYAVRNNTLNSSIIMRSNNAPILFPYNIFEFSLLSEAIAREIDVNLGSIHHFAFSMHIYDYSYSSVKECIKEYESNTQRLKQGIEMPSMPDGKEEGALEDNAGSPLKQIKRLVILESIIRHRIAGATPENIQELIDLPDQSDYVYISEKKLDLRLNDYWKQFYYIVLLFLITNHTNLFKKEIENQKVKYVANDPSSEDIYNKVRENIEEVYRNFIHYGIEAYTSVDDPRELELPVFIIPNNVKMIATHESDANKNIVKFISEYETLSQKSVNWKTYERLQNEYLGAIGFREVEDMRKEIMKKIEEYDK